jgi:signal transduction histidine kinase
VATEDLVGHNLADQKILHTVAEYIKTPLTRILAHLQLVDYGASLDRDFMEVTAVSAVRLIDSYLLSTQIYNQQQQLVLEPVSVAAVMNDVFQQMSAFARLQNKQPELIVGKKLGLVMASSRALHAALTTLTYSILQQGSHGHSRVTFMVTRSGGKIRCGIFDSSLQVSSDTLSKVQKLHGRASRPSADLPHGAGSGLALADGIITGMGSKLVVTKSRYGKGLVADFLPSTQLAFL